MDTTDDHATPISAAASVATGPRPTLSTAVDNLPSLIAINVTAQVPLKLTATNYCAWRAQFDSLLIGYDLYGFVDGSNPCPSATLIAPNSTVPMPNPA